MLKKAVNLGAQDAMQENYKCRIFLPNFPLDAAQKVLSKLV